MTLEGIFFFFVLGVVLMMIVFGLILLKVQKDNNQAVVTAISHLREEKDEWADPKQERPLCIRHEFTRPLRIVLEPEHQVMPQSDVRARELKKISRQMEALSK